MKHLNQYIIENLDNHIINEGKILNAIKNWFKKLFKPTDKKYDRYTNNGKYILEHPKEYIKYLSKNFKNENIVSSVITDEKIMNEINNKNSEFNIQFNKDHDYSCGFFTDKEVRDIVYIVEGINSKNDYYEILNIKISQIFQPYFKLNNIIDILIGNKNAPKYTSSLLEPIILIKRKSNKELYNEFNGKFGFKKGVKNNEHIVYLIRSENEEKYKNWINEKS